MIAVSCLARLACPGSPPLRWLANLVCLLPRLKWPAQCLPLAIRQIEAMPPRAGMFACGAQHYVLIK